MWCEEIGSNVRKDLKLLYAKVGRGGREPPAEVQALRREPLRACQQLAAARPSCPLLLAVHHTSPSPSTYLPPPAPPCSLTPTTLTPSFYSCAVCVCVRAFSSSARPLYRATLKPTRLDPSGTDRPGLRVRLVPVPPRIHSISYTAVLSPVLRADSSSAASASCSSHSLRPSSPSHTFSPTSPTARV